MNEEQHSQAQINSKSSDTIIITTIKLNTEQFDLACDLSIDKLFAHTLLHSIKFVIHKPSACYRTHCSDNTDNMTAKTATHRCEPPVNWKYFIRLVVVAVVYFLLIFAFFFFFSCAIEQNRRLHFNSRSASEWLNTIKLIHIAEHKATANETTTKMIVKQN